MSVWFPRLPIDRFLRRQKRERLEHDQSTDLTHPLLLIARSAQRQVVVDCCPLSDHAGVRPGMSLADACALLPVAPPEGPPEIHDARPEHDASALSALAIWAERFSPMVAIDPPDGLLMDISGCGRVFGGDRQLAWNLVRRCQGDIGSSLHGGSRGSLRIRARVSVAPTLGGAWALARFSGQPVTVVDYDGLRESLRDLDIRALRIDSEAVLALNEIGIQTIGQVMDLPRSVLPARFGSQLLFRLDQALGSAMEVIQPVRPIDPPRTERLFDGPTTQWEAIELTIRDLLGQLISRLGITDSGITRLVVTLKRSDLPPVQLQVMLSRATRDVRHLWTLLRPKLERAHLGFGIDSITLHATRLGSMHARQAECWTDRSTHADHAGDHQLGELLDTLCNRLGVDRVLRISIAASHLPERAMETSPVIADERLGMHAQPDRAALKDTHTIDRPTILLDRPIPVQVTRVTPDGPVVSISYRSEQLAIIRSIGPERIAPEWWRHHEPTRDYYRIQDARGRWLWLYRELQTGRCFVHGLWA